MATGDCDVERLRAHVPVLFTRWLKQEGGELEAPAGERIEVAALFADLCGFSDLTRQVTTNRPSGVEELRLLINSVLSDVIRHVVYHGGDVVKFAGDAVLVLWPVGRGSPSAAIRRAVQCALALCESAANTKPVAGFRPRMHVGVGTGEALAMYVGGVAGQSEVLVAGEPIVQMSNALARAEAGQVAVSSQAWAHVKDHFAASEAGRDGVVIESARGAMLPPRPLSHVSLPPEAAKGMLSLIPRGLRSSLLGGHPQWLSEIRKVSVVFINLVGIDYDARDALQLVHRATCAIQSVVDRYEGSVDRLIMDDKGTGIIGVFGLAPQVHEDDEIRAVMSAMGIRLALERIGIRSAIGISTGRVFCGLAGDDTRCEYAVMGATVNLACRLMEAADGGVLCDAATQTAASTRIRFREERSLEAKGSDRPLACFRPIDQARETRLTGPMVGRTSERAWLKARVDRLRRGEGNTVLVRGDPGIGKSRLMEDLVELAREADVRCLRGQADRYERSAPYRVWRSVLEQRLELDSSDPEGSRARVLEHLADEPRLVTLAPILNDVLPLDFPANESTSSMRGQVRADNMRTVLLHLLSRKRGEPTLIILEDGQWFDSPSWALCTALKRQCPDFMLVVTSRVTLDTELPVYVEIVSDPATEELALDSLSEEASLELARWHLGVDSLSPEVGKVIASRGIGNPLFIRLLASHLRESSLVTVDQGCCRASGPSLEGLELPGKIEDVIRVRIGDLGESQRTTLKVATVIGSTFEVPILRSVHPNEDDLGRLEEDLHELVRRQIIAVEPDTNVPTYSFQHALIQEVAYNLMTYSQRASIHMQVARWYEGRIGVDQAPSYSLLAHHYSSAEEAATIPEQREQACEKAIEYLEKAGAQAMHGYANREAVRFLEHALCLVQRSTAERDTLQLAHWERLVGEAHLRLGHLHKSREHLNHSVGLSDRPVPSSRLGMVSGCLLQAALILLRRRSKVRSASTEERSRIVESAQAYELLSEIHYFSNEHLRVLYMAVRGLSQVERIAPSSELARLHANMSIVAGGVPLHRVARACVDTALKTVQTVPDEFTLAFVLCRVAVFFLGIGEWEKAREYVTEGAGISERLNARRRLTECLAVIANVEYHSGRFAESRESYRRVQRLASASGDVQHYAWGADGEMENLVRLGSQGYLEAVRKGGMELLSQVSENLDDCEELRAAGLLAIAELRAGNVELAWKHAQHGMRLSDSWYPNFAALEGHAATAEVYLRLWESGDARFLPGGMHGVQRSARRACDVFVRYSQHFPIGVPRALLWRGLCDWLCGRRGRARRRWERSIEASERLLMPYETALTKLEVGLRLPAGDPTRVRYLDDARRGLAMLGAAYDLRRCPPTDRGEVRLAAAL